LPQEASNGIQIDRFIAGLHTNRAAISTPFRVSYGRSIQYKDALIGGLNVEISPKNTLWRRAGWSKYSSASYSGTAQAIAGCDLQSQAGAVLHALLSTTSHVYDIGTSSMTSIYSKTTTAQTFFQQVGLYEYMSDGAANIKWDGETVTNNGIATPTKAPTVPNLNLFDTVGNTQTVHAWVPGAVYSNTTSSPQTYYLMAPTGEIQMAVVAKGTKVTSQTAAPNWANQYGIFGGLTTDGQLKWANCGVPISWPKSTIVTNSSFSTNGQVTASSNQSTGSLSAGGSASVTWSIGATSAGINPTSPTTGNSNVLTLNNLGLNVPAGATVDGLIVGVNRASNRANAVNDVTVQLVQTGSPIGSNRASSGFWPQTAQNSYVIPTSGGTKFNYGSNQDKWGASLTPTICNDATFGVEFVINQGSTRTTTAALVFPITVTVYYHIAGSDISGITYSTVVLDSNNNLQAVKTGGTTGGSAPAWATTVGGTTTDNTVTWVCLGTANFLPCLFSWTYAYGFHTSSAHISTMSPTLQLQAPIIGNNVPIQGFGSGDTQCDRNDVYRTTDGGSILLFDQSAPNVNASTTWEIFDSLLDADLNELLIGPIADANDPPPTGMTIIAYFMGRMWGVVGNLLYFSAGPDCINGDGNQAWPPANVFTLPAPITGLAATTQGLVVYTGIDIEVVLGGPQTNTFWLQPLLKNLGIQSPNCLTQDGDEMLFISSQGQAMSLSPSSKNEFGFVVADVIASTFSPASSYIAVHRAGQDQGTFLSDGSTNALRYNMNAEGWDTIQQPENGIGPLASVDTAIGTRRLLSASGGFVLFRDVNTFTDAGTAYAANAIVGSIVVSEPGPGVASVKSIYLQSAPTGSPITIDVLPNEISGSFTNIPLSNADPYQLPASTTINKNEYQWLGAQSMLPDILRHLQVKITFSATDTVQNEVFSLSIV
jgi:hypothetical protein